MNIMQEVARIQALIVFAKSRVPKTAGHLGGKSFMLTVDCIKRASTTSNPQVESPFSGYFRRESPMKIQCFLPPSFSAKEDFRKDESRAVHFFYLRTAPNHPPGTVRMLMGDTRSICHDKGCDLAGFTRCSFRELGQNDFNAIKLAG